MAWELSDDEQRLVTDVLRSTLDSYPAPATAGAVVVLTIGLALAMTASMRRSPRRALASCLGHRGGQTGMGPPIRPR